MVRFLGHSRNYNKINPGAYYKINRPIVKEGDKDDEIYATYPALGFCICLFCFLMHHVKGAIPQHQVSQWSQ